MSSVTVDPRASEVQHHGSFDRCSVLHLYAVEGAVQIRHKVEWCVLGKWQEHRGVSLDEVGLDLRNGEVTLVLGVMAGRHGAHSTE